MWEIFKGKVPGSGYIGNCVEADDRDESCTECGQLKSKRQYEGTYIKVTASIMTRPRFCARGI